MKPPKLNKPAMPMVPIYCISRDYNNHCLGFSKEVAGVMALC